MRKSRAETAETRKRIVEIAARAFRCNGIHATGVAEIMAAAGLTHGGFYRHFASKEQLVAEACASSMNELVESAEAAVEGGDASFWNHIAHFLSPENRDDRLGGCPLVAVGSELARADEDTRQAVSKGFQDLVGVMAKHGRSSGSAVSRLDAVFMLSSMIGAVTMSRIVDDPRLSAQILGAARKRLIGPQVKPGTSRSSAKRA